MASASKMTAADVKDALRRHYPASASPMPGPWTCIEEWQGIDLLAFKAWRPNIRIGHEVKVSRSDMRAELLRPHKRALNVAWCHRFYFVVPDGLLTQEELAYKEPKWEPKDWLGEPCPGLGGIKCIAWRSKKTHTVDVPVPTTLSWNRTQRIVCQTCKGKGVVEKSRVELEAPTLWVPRDVGLMVVKPTSYGGYVQVVKHAPPNHTPPRLSDNELCLLVRWVSIRPDPRHRSAA